MFYISSADEFELDNIHNSDPEDLVINTVAWGGNGNINLTEKLFNEVETNLEINNNMNSK